MQYILRYWRKDNGKEWEKGKEIISGKSDFEKRMQELNIIGLTEITIKELYPMDLVDKAGQF